MHNVLLALGAWLPGLQATDVTAPSKQKNPAGQALHCTALVRLVATEYEPPGHGTGVDVPAAQNIPSRQFVQAVAAINDWNLPAGQSTHVDWLGCGLKVPRAQCDWFAEPVAHAWPAPHERQLLSPSDGWCVPATHWPHEPLPDAAKLPGSHTFAFADVDLDAHMCPASHERQSAFDAAPEESRYRPGGHAIGALDPCKQKLPGRQALQSPCPSVSWYDPAKHWSQLPLWAAAAVPVPHAVWLSAPASHAWPTSQAMQLLSPSDDWCVPAAQSAQLALPAAA